MKSLAFLCALCLVSAAAVVETLIPSTLDPAMAAAREEAFIPWSTPDQSGDYWKKLASKNVPIYCERKPGFSRDIYTPNPGTGYWVLGGLSQKSLFRVHKEKLAIDDTLISASVYTDEKGNKEYWALWAPRTKAHLLTDRMQALGISQARIEFSWGDKFQEWATSLKAFSGFITWTSLGLNVLLVLIIAALAYRLAKAPPADKYGRKLAREDRSP